jgi:hypothetical protein
MESSSSKHITETKTHFAIKIAKTTKRLETSYSASNKYYLTEEAEKSAKP